jgi:hypothetical protein
LGDDLKLRNEGYIALSIFNFQLGLVELKQAYFSNAADSLVVTLGIDALNRCLS